jgi:hypothetical protein
MPVPAKILATDVLSYTPTEVEEADNTFDDDNGIAMMASKRTRIIHFIIEWLKLPEDSTMVKYFDQQGWTELVHVTTLGIEEFKDFCTVKDDGFTFEAQPMWVHIQLWKGFLLFYWRKCKEFSTTLSTDDVINAFSFTCEQFHDYLGLEVFQLDSNALVVMPAAVAAMVGRAVAVVVSYC